MCRERGAPRRQRAPGCRWWPCCFSRFELAWFWVFPSRTLSTDPRAGIIRRRQGGRQIGSHPQAGVGTHAPPQFRDAPAPQRRGYPPDSENLGHAPVETTMVYTHVVEDLRSPARSPLDLLGSQSLWQKC